VGDLLTIQTGDVGVTSIVTKELAGANCHALIISRFKEKISDPRFYCQYFNFERGRAALKKIETGTTMKHLNGGDMKRIFLPSPPIYEQCAIAEVLSDVDALLVKLENTVAKKRKFKQAAMQQLLTGKTRLSGFMGEWKNKRLDNITRAQKGQLITINTLTPGSIPVIAGGKQPAYFHSSANRFGKTITISASGASAGYVAFHNSPIFASDCSTISESNSYCIEFLYYFLSLRQEEIYNLQTGGAQPHINPKDIAPMLIQIPSDITEQSAIANILSDIDTELLKLEERLSKTKQLKLAMMQELLIGKTRLINKEISYA
jgi:type I restriction enzyme S subunit